MSEGRAYTVQCCNELLGRMRDLGETALDELTYNEATAYHAAFQRFELLVGKLNDRTKP